MRWGEGAREEAPGLTRISARMLMKEKCKIGNSEGEAQAEFSWRCMLLCAQGSQEVYCW